MLHTEVLTDESKKLFPKLSIFKEDFYLAGGTALALQLGHRISVDLDLFSPAPIKKTLLPRVEEIYKGMPIETLINNSHELTVLIHEVKHTFLHYPFPVMLPFEKDDTINLLSSKEILATKAYTIGRRGVFKDYVDLSTGLESGTSSLQEIIDLAKGKYNDAFNDRLFLEQLVYLDDITEDTIIMLNSPTPTKQELIEFFSGEISKIKL
jgi:predicted nucleotidyltransferase component of viral defense system